MLTRSAALSQLEIITKDLAAAHRELAQVLAAEKEGKLRVYQESDESTVSARDRQGEMMVMGLTIDSLKIKGEIAALIAEREYLTIVVQYAGD